MRIAANLEHGRSPVADEGLLADQVDGAGRGGAAVVGAGRTLGDFDLLEVEHVARNRTHVAHAVDEDAGGGVEAAHVHRVARSEEHTSELQSLMRISYAVFCLKTKKQNAA